MVISVENNFLFLVCDETRRSHLQMSAIISSWEWVARMMAGASGCGGHGGDTWPQWPRSWWDWYETLTTYWFVLWRPEERDDQWPGEARRPHLLRSCRPAPAHLVCNLPILVSEGGGDYQKLSSTASLQSSNLNFRPAGLSDWRLAGSTSVILIITRGWGGGRMFLV